GECISFDARHAKSGKVKLRLPSVGATENLIEFACLLSGKTTILNPAREPEIVDLANFLNKMGAKILGAGTKKITIYGVDKLEGTIYTPMGDRIVSGTIMTAVAIAGGDVTMTNACPYQNEKFIKILCSLGCQIDIKNDIIHISRLGSLTSNKVISTDYYPGFPTDLQSMMVALAIFCQGKTIIKENIFEDRFLTVPELQKMGANIDILSHKKIRVKGGEIFGAEVFSRDLRGGASLVLAGLGAEGETTVTDIYHIDRGYDHIEKVLTSLGANIRRI
ncbi:MAG: UDP-N-acetylglucosamine 1-carboxyvinyltransferase, partial [Clostridia bacterium]|nr:UDP-N-acetylglucosamine 1-carboxyvinyltransferase [Clostridia bacterium]